MKRYQECNSLEKLWRRRWYLALPFMFLSYKIKDFKVRHHSNDGEKIEYVCNGYEPTNQELWKILIGTIQLKMNWYYTKEEVLKGVDNF